MAQMTGGEAVAKQLLAEGVEVVFALPGVQIMHIFNGFFTQPGIRVISTRHEQTTAYMADGYARTTGKIGVCLVVPGPGAYNAAAAMGTAYAASSPVLMLSGQIDSDLIGTGRGALHEIGDQLGFMKPVTKWQDRVVKAQDIPEGIHEAIRQIKTGRPRPVEFEIPPDTLATVADIQTVEAEEYSRPSIPAETLRAVVNHLASARRPLIWAGGGVNLAGADAELRRVADALGAPVVLTREGKGAVPDTNPMQVNAGAFGTSGAASAELMRQADVIFAVGTRFNINPAADWAPRPDQVLVHLDIDDTEFSNKLIKKPTMGVVADAKLGLGQVGEALSGARVQSAWDKRAVAALKKRDDDAMRAQRPAPYGVWEQVRKDLPEDTIVVGGITGADRWPGTAFATLKPRTLVTSSYMGTLGYGFPTALGAKVGNPNTPVLSLTGDGGFSYAVGELATAVQYKINLVTVIFDNHRFGASNDDQLTRFKGNVIGTELFNPDFVALAAAYGVKGIHVTDLDRFPAAIREAVAANAPVVVHVDGDAAYQMDRVRAT
ncbi:MAG: thiamine pyrophosphate-binding protein [Chloroflexi bacterium]|nr:thiamine pyrophosphate-binding protein [Chloroflexota bacterium]